MKGKVIYALLIFIVACTSKGNQPNTSTGSALGNHTDDTVCMVWIQGGTFTMGAEKSDGDNHSALPLHEVELSGFWIDKTEVTNAQFAAFVKATGYHTLAERPIDWEELKKQVPPGTPKPADEDLQPGSLVFAPPSQSVLLDDYTRWWRWVVGANWQHPLGPSSSIDGMDNYPVVHVCFEDAEAYAKWSGKRLPTEAEFEFAARGRLKQNKFAWGNELTPGGKYMANYFQGNFPHQNIAKDGFSGIAPVASFPANGYGLFDMVGNVWEWNSDWYAKKYESNTAVLVKNPKGPDHCSDPDDPYAIKHVTKGGSFLCSDQYCSNYRPSGRQGTAYDSGMNHIGFRCVKDK